MPAHPKLTKTQKTVLQSTQLAHQNVVTVMRIMISKLMSGDSESYFIEDTEQSSESEFESENGNNDDDDKITSGDLTYTPSEWSTHLVTSYLSATEVNGN